MIDSELLTRKVNLVDFLPYSLAERQEAMLHSSLREYSMLIQATLEAIDAWELHKFSQFDALVGENACQIRAAWISIGSKKNLIFLAELRPQLHEIQKKISLLLKEAQLSLLMRTGLSLEEIVLANDLSISLNYIDAFIVQCFVLNSAKIADYHNPVLDTLFTIEKCDPRRLKKFGNISSSFAKHLVSKLRKSASQTSILLVREAARKYTNCQNLQRFLSEGFTYTHNSSLLCTPMFWTYKALLQALKKEGISIHLNVKFLINHENGYKVVDEDSLLFDYNDASGWKVRKQSIKENRDRHEVIVIIQGVAALPSDTQETNYIKDWRREFLEYNLEEVILAGAADHRQYPCQNESEKFESLRHIELERFKCFARRQGFSLCNPTRFFIQHVYAENLINFRARN